MSENKLLDLSFEFAVAVVNLADSVTAPKSSYMTDQLARAGTSVGANIHEAQYAQSKRDFVSKLEIALKEPITFKKVGGVVLSFVGIIYLIMSKTSLGGTAETTTFGIIMLILNSLSFSMYLGIFKPLIGKYSVVTFMKWIFLFAFALSTHSLHSILPL